MLRRIKKAHIIETGGGTPPAENEREIRMGNIDTITKEYISDNRRFADLFNYLLYGGREVIRPQDLEERDATELALPYGVDQKVIGKQQMRDNLKAYCAKEAGGITYLLLGVESQADQNFAMAVKNMNYDAMNYAAQVSEAAKRHREHGPQLRGAEYLSGFGKEDRLTPVVTLTLYWGPDEWNAPRSLHEMFPELPQEILRFVPDYQINLIAPAEIEDYEKFHTEIGPVLEFIRNSRDSQKLWDLLNENPVYREMDKESAVLLNAVAGLKLNLSDVKGDVDMCKAWEDYAKERGKEYAKEYAKDLTMKSVRNMIRKGITYEDARGILEGISDEELKQLYEEAEKEMAVL